MNPPHRLFPIVLLVLAFLCSLPAQERIRYLPEAESLFTEGIACYKAARYRDAVVLFDTILREMPESHRITAAMVMKGKALYQLNENLETARTLRALVEQYPTSGYVADAHLTLGLVYQRVERYEEALEEFLTAWETMPQPPVPRLSRDIFAAMDTLVDRNLPASVLGRLLAGSTTASRRCYIWLKIGEKEAARENIAAASIALDTITARYSEKALEMRIVALRSRVAERRSVKLGVLLPLMRRSEPSAVKEIGNEVYEGIVFALDQYASDPWAHVKVTLETRDTERDARVAVRCLAELADIKELIGIIGPVFSTSARAAAAIAQSHGVPLVTPTANANGIAAIGPYIFQANSDYDTRGRAMARFAVLGKGLKNVAVLAPNDTYGKFLAEGFIDEANRLGAKVVANQWYQRSTSDLKPQLASIRRAGMLLNAEPLISFAGKVRTQDIMKLVSLGIPLKRVDSLMNRGAVMSAAALLGPRGKTIMDSLDIRMTYDESKYDSLEYPVNGIQAIYLPISSPGEIGVVSSQIVYFHFETQLLGSGEWNSYAELDANKRYCRGVIFESDVYIDSASASYSAFSNGYMEKFKKRPTKNSLYGYDAASVVLAAIRTGAGSRDALAQALSLVHDFQGLRSKIGFSHGRVNCWLPILQFDGDAVQRLDEMKVE